jgi:predicted DNA-binding transcriptional regulator YafY
MRGDQLSRQWRLLQLIDRPVGITVDDAAGELGCHRRTIWRDLRVLQDAGFPLFDEKAADGYRGLWRLSPEFRANLPLKLTLAEMAALVMSRDLLASLGASALGPSISAAFEKLSRVLSKDALHLLDRMRETIGVRALGAKLQTPVAEFIPALQSALLDRRTVRARYYSYSRDEEMQRSIDPYQLTYFNGGVYLVGHCHLRQTVRVFAIERIRSLQVLRSTFTIPLTFDAKEYLEGAWGILRGDLVTVRVLFSKAVARYIKGRLWHPSQKFRELDDGRLEVNLRVADTLEVRRWILGYGVHAEVLEPVPLRGALRAEAEALVARLTPSRRPLASTPSPRTMRSPAALRSGPVAAGTRRQSRV